MQAREIICARSLVFSAGLNKGPGYKAMLKSVIRGEGMDGAVVTAYIQVHC